MPTSVRWVAWLTPFGWIELMQPFTGNNAWPLLPALVTVVGVAGVAIGFVALLNTDGVGTNLLFGLIGGLGLIVLIVGLAMTRWEGRPRAAAVKVAIPRSIAARVGLGDSNAAAIARARETQAAYWDL